MGFDTLTEGGRKPSAYVEAELIGDVLPKADNTYDLGSASYRFKRLYVAGTSYLDGDLILTGNRKIKGDAAATGLKLSSSSGFTYVGVYSDAYGGIYPGAIRVVTSNAAENAGIDRLNMTGDADIATLTMSALKLVGQIAVIEHHTADDTLTKEESGSIHTNLGEDGAMTLTLPQDARAGDHFFFVVMFAGELRIDPGAAGAIYIGGAKQTDDKYISADDEGESIMLVADGNGDWAALFGVGTWSVEG